jgi:hypothetical protein
MGCYWGVLQEPNIHGGHQGYPRVLPQKLRALWCLNTNPNVLCCGVLGRYCLHPQWVFCYWIVNNSWRRSLSSDRVMFTLLYYMKIDLANYNIWTSWYKSNEIFVAGLGLHHCMISLCFSTADAETTALGRSYAPWEPASNPRCAQLETKGLSFFFLFLFFFAPA